jgi:hypothetical protein
VTVCKEKTKRITREAGQSEESMENTKKKKEKKKEKKKKGSLSHLHAEDAVLDGGRSFGGSGRGSVNGLGRLMEGVDDDEDDHDSLLGCYKSAEKSKEHQSSDRADRGLR